MENVLKELLTAKELASALKIKSIQTIYDWRYEGLPAVIDKPLRFDLDEVIKWLKSRSKKD